MKKCDTVPYEKLIEAIIIQAAKDYRKALKRLAQEPECVQAKRMITEIEIFVRSRWYKDLTSVNGVKLLKKLKRETQGRH